ncbi:leucine-rich repeat-containing protein 31 [Chanos chanos]|uniref:Leucine-rich repeat-containing protein 31 n=1 Tax=Chanos chanos TaxID=29144 RepID=A0A6J2UZA1_CHACN|nr:leucine-rich repeat-containing protein 31 [Chanos chanos]
MESSDPPKGQEGSPKRSPLDLIMNQIRKRRSFTDRKKSSVSRLFRTSESNDKIDGGVSEMKETVSAEGKEGRENTEPGKEGSDTADSEICSVVGWGRVKQFVEKLGKTPDSQYLSLCHCDLTATDVTELATLLPFLSQLEVMDLSWNELVGGALKALVFHLQHVGRLRELKLSNCRLTPQDLAALGEALDCVPQLEVLDLSWNPNVGKGNLRCLTEHLHSGNKLREFLLVDCQLSEADVVALSEALNGMSCLEILDISNTRLLLKEVEKLGCSLRATPRLKTLKLSMCGLQPETLKILSETLKFLPALQHLDLSCNKEAGGGFTPVFSSLALTTHLQSLDIHSCCLRVNDISALVQVLPSLRELTELDVSSNKNIGDVVMSLFPILPLSNMKRLPLNNCNLSSETYQALVSAMQSLSQLESLNVSWNKRISGNLKQLLEPLRANSMLQELRLSSCDLTTEDLLHLASAAKRGALSQLKRLDLSYNGSVGDGGWVSLFGEAGSLKGLEELDVSLRPSTSSPVSSWLPALLEALPKLTSLRHVSLKRWAFSSRETEKLEKTLQKRNVVAEYDLVSPAVQPADLIPA